MANILKTDPISAYALKSDDGFEEPDPYPAYAVKSDDGFYENQTNILPML